MSRIVGTMLLNALLDAGHNEWHTVRTSYDPMKDEILVRFDAGMKPDGKCVNFNIPSYIFDPVEYAKARWPEWFVERGPVREPVQLDLFKQE